MKKIIFLLILSISVISCMEVLEIELEPEDKKLVMNSLISPDSLIKVNLSKSINSLDGDAFIKFIDDAEVKLYENGQFIENLNYDSCGYYVSSQKPDLNKEYKVIATHENYPEIEAQTIIPYNVPIENFRVEIEIDSFTETWTDPVTGETFDTTLYEVTGEGTAEIVFNDPAKTDDFYMITFTIIKPIYTWDNQGNMYITGYQRAPVWANIEGNEENMNYFTINQYMQGYFFNDVLFNGEEKTVHAKIDTWSIFDYNTQGLPESPFYVHLYSISEELYQYMISYDKYQQNVANPFSEPVNIFSNVKNGLGLFASFYAYTDSLEFIDVR